MGKYAISPASVKLPSVIQLKRWNHGKSGRILGTVVVTVAEARKFAVGILAMCEQERGDYADLILALKTTGQVSLMRRRKKPVVKSVVTV